MHSNAPARRSASNTSAESSGPKVSISGYIAKVFYTGDRNGRSLLLVKARDGSAFKVDGPLPVPPQVGMRIQAEALAVEHPKYGKQYRADLITEEVPIDRAGAIAFMSKTLTGVGRALAERLFDAFGERIYETIQNSPESLLKVNGLTREKLGPLLESWKEHANTRMLWTYLAKHQIGGSTAAKIYAKFGAQSASVAMQRPYQLTAVDGVGFLTVDKIALSSGIRRDSVGRVIAALRFTLDTNKKRGNTCCPRETLVQQTTRLLGSDDEADPASGPSPSRDSVAKAIDECIERGALRLIQSRGTDCVASPTLDLLETEIAQNIARLVKGKAPEPAEESDIEDAKKALAEEAKETAKHLGDEAQIEAVAMPFQHSVSVITGGPGCGKTTVTRQITKVAEAAGMRVVMMAPTGKAARRMAEVTGKAVDTIHSTLHPDSGELKTFKFNEDNPLTGDLFVIDESSMIDAYVASALLRAIPAGAKVLFVGDVDQLPSVGPGAIFRDLIQSEVIPVARLNTPHRTALNSDIVVNAHRIIHGNADAVDTSGQRDFTFQDLSDDLAQKVIVDRYVEMLSTYGRDGVQVLAPTYDGLVGVTSLNTALQARVNPPAADKAEIVHHETVFRLGDRVMQTANNKQLNVVNGEVGFVTAVDQEAKSLKVNFGAKEVALSEKALLSLDLAYAITIHKSQGSEYAGVITVCSSSASFMLDRNLTYTAVTRAKKHSEVIGDVQAFKAAVRKPGANRWTALTNSIRHLFDLPPLLPVVHQPKPRPTSPLLAALRATNRPVMDQHGSPMSAQPKGLPPPPQPGRHLDNTPRAPIGRLALLKQPNDPQCDVSVPTTVPSVDFRSSIQSQQAAVDHPPSTQRGGKLSLFRRSSVSAVEQGDMWNQEEPPQAVLNDDDRQEPQTRNPPVKPSGYRSFQHQ